MWITTAFVALALCQSAETPRPQPPATTPWQRAETLRRLVEKKLEEQAAAIGPQPARSQDWGEAWLRLPGPDGRVADAAGSPTRTDARAPGPFDPASAPPGEADPLLMNDALKLYAARAAEYDKQVTVTDAFWRAHDAFDVSSHVEFVPGLGTVVSAKVPVRCEFIAPEPGEPAEAAPAATLPADEEWDAAAEGRKPADTRSALAGYLGGRAAVAAPRRLRYATDALAAVKRTVLDAAWRFGGKLELARGERLAVVVEVRPTTSRDQALLGSDPYVNELFPADKSPATESPDQRLELLGRRFPQIVAPAPQRLIVVITAEDLKAFRAGDVEPNEQAAAASGDF